MKEKGLLWLRGDTERWDVHYVSFACNIGQVAEAGLDEENIHAFAPDDVTRVSAIDCSRSCSRKTVAKSQAAG